MFLIYLIIFSFVNFYIKDIKKFNFIIIYNNKYVFYNNIIICIYL